MKDTKWILGTPKERMNQQLNQIECWCDSIESVLVVIRKQCKRLKEEIDKEVK